MLSKNCFVNHVQFLGDLIFGHTTPFLDANENTISHTASQSAVFEIMLSFQTLWNDARKNTIKVWIPWKSAGLAGGLPDMCPYKSRESIKSKGIINELSNRRQWCLQSHHPKQPLQCRYWSFQLLLVPVHAGALPGTGGRQSCVSLTGAVWFLCSAVLQPFFFFFFDKNKVS